MKKTILSERIVYLRVSKKLTQVELAKKSDVCQSTIAQIESGRKDPSLSTLKKLAQALDCHIATFFLQEEK